MLQRSHRAMRVKRTLNAAPVCRSFRQVRRGQQLLPSTAEALQPFGHIKAVYHCIDTLASYAVDPLALLQRADSV